MDFYLKIFALYQNIIYICIKKSKQQLKSMTTATYTTMQNLAKQAAAYITKLNGEAQTFEIESNGITAVIAYAAEIIEDKGDYWTAPSWSIEDETVVVEAVYDEDGNEDKEAVGWLKKMLN